MKILLISENLPVNGSSGAKMRTCQLCNELLKVAEVDFVQCCSYTDPEKVSHANPKFRFAGTISVNTKDLIPGGMSFIWDRKFTDTARFRFLFGRLHSLFYYRSLKGARESLERLVDLSEYDYVFARYYQYGLWFDLFNLKNFIVDCDDCVLESLRSQQEGGSYGFIQRCVFRLARKINRNKFEKSLNLAKSVLFSGKTELKWKDHFYSYPNKLLSKREFVDTKPVGNRILFVGKLDYPPNCSGLDRFLVEYWPELRANFGDIELDVVGGELDGNLKQIWEKIPGVKIHGFVESLDDSYRNCIAAIVPVFSGSGTHIKVMEALSMSRCLLVTGFSSRGYSDILSREDGMFTCNNVSDYVESVGFIIQNRDRYQDLVKSGFSKYRKHYLVDDNAELDPILSEAVFGKSTAISV